MRGKHDHCRHRRLRRWIIPAHAGQTLAFAKSSSAWPDHPRACGANWNNLVHGNYRNGSSPRMRGKLIERRERDHILRIIPAHAGQTRDSSAHVRRHADHPRACGANWVRASPALVVEGSSPRMRGKQFLPVGEVLHGRIIPAHAGQTKGGDPRAEAEYGSSPRMRGKLCLYLQYIPLSRIIPAHAGQTANVGEYDSAIEDHPRACGANWNPVSYRFFRYGSSPRMRGKPPDLP